MKKLNCWEHNKCGLGLGSVTTGQTCPVVQANKLNKVHDGHNAGRACWVIAGTYCRGEVQGTFAKKYANCEKCDFYQKVRQEEGPKFKLSIVLLNQLNSR